MTEVTNNAAIPISREMASEHKTYVVNFGVKDRFNRQIGGMVTTFTSVIVADADCRYGWKFEPGTYYGLRVNAARDGQWYGASHGSRYFRTEADREAAIKKYLKEARKRAEKISAR